MQVSIVSAHCVGRRWFGAPVYIRRPGTQCSFYFFFHGPEFTSILSGSCQWYQAPSWYMKLFIYATAEAIFAILATSRRSDAGVSLRTAAAAAVHRPVPVAIHMVPVTGVYVYVYVAQIQDLDRYRAHAYAYAHDHEATIVRCLFQKMWRPVRNVYRDVRIAT